MASKCHSTTASATRLERGLVGFGDRLLNPTSFNKRGWAYFCPKNVHYGLIAVLRDHPRLPDSVEKVGLGGRRLFRAQEARAWAPLRKNQGNSAFQTIQISTSATLICGQKSRSDFFNRIALLQTVSADNDLPKAC